MKAFRSSIFGVLWIPRDRAGIRPREIRNHGLNQCHLRYAINKDIVQGNQEGAVTVSTNGVRVRRQMKGMKSI
jgi:hypothetical protein